MSILCTDWAVAVNSTVNNTGKRYALGQMRYSFVIENRHKAVSRMELRRRLDANAAVVPVRAVDALVTNTKDGLITTVTKGGMANAPTC
jgi:hypothetical protein